MVIHLVVSLMMLVLFVIAVISMISDLVQQVPQKPVPPMQVQVPKGWTLCRVTPGEEVTKLEFEVPGQDNVVVTVPTHS